jgi:hypothetical protein
MKAPRDDDDVSNAGGAKRPHEPRDEWTAIGIRQQRLGAAHARGIACSEDDSGQHRPIVLQSIGVKGVLARLDFTVELPYTRRSFRGRRAL